MSELIERLRDYGLTLEPNVVICCRSVVDEAAATITQLQAELAEAREVPGRIVAWLNGTEAMGMGRDEVIDAIEARDWNKP